MMEGSNAISNSPLASSRVQQYNSFAEDKDDLNSDMSKSAWMLVDEDFDAEPEKLETTLTQVHFLSISSPRLTIAD